VKPPPIVVTLLGASWSAPNYRDRQVSRVGGPAFAGLAVAAAAGAGAPFAPVACAASGALLAGRIDDVWGSLADRGLHGHLGALRRGRITTGAAKIAVLTATGSLTALTLWPANGGSAPNALVGSGSVPVLDLATVAGCVALGANLANLFDLQPGRALKVVLAASLPASVTGLAGGDVLTGVASAALACLPGDLTERTMLGDAGANPAGALTALGLVLAGGPRARRLLLAGLLALNLASEAVSFSRVIRGVRPLRWLDDAGRLEPA
jgi:hypothetical protein